MTDIFCSVVAGRSGDESFVVPRHADGGHEGTAGWAVHLDGWACARGSAVVPPDGGAGLVRDALARSGPMGLDDVVGEYAVVAWHPGTRRLVAGRDPMASRPLFWTWDGRRLTVASRVPALLAQPRFGRRPDEGAIAELICERPSTTTATVWAGVSRLPGGHALVFDAAAWSPRLVRFWRPEPGPVVPDPRVGLRHLVAQAVRRRCPDGELVGSELSGGFDSSTVLGVALEGGMQPRAYSTVYPGQPCDETPLIEASLAHHRIAGRLLEVVPPSVEERRACVRAHGLVGDYVLGSEAPARAAAADGCTAILTGDLGDEVLGGMGLSGADDLHRLRPGALRMLVTGPRRRRLAALTYRDRLRWRLGRTVRRGWIRPLPSWVPGDLARRVDLHDRFAASEAAPPDGPPSFRAQMAVFDSWWTQSRSDLAGIDFAPVARQRAPLGDVELAEFSLRIPQALKETADDRRHLHREVFADVLAPVVRARTGKAEFSAVIHTHLAAGPDLLTGEPAIVDLGWVDPEGLRLLREEVLAARPSLAHTTGLWAYATLNELELWAQELLG